jgi:protein-tyrosine phosphatase
VLDGTPPSAEQLSRAVRWIDEQRARGPVLVHCAAGHGRSATVVLAWLVSCGEFADVETGLANLRRLRPGVALKPRQLARVREFKM